jgi:hypothetical protein
MRQQVIRTNEEVPYVEYRSDAPYVTTQAITEGLVAEDPRQEDSLTVVRLRFATPLRAKMLYDVAYDSQLHYHEQPEPICRVTPTQLIDEVHMVLHFIVPPKQVWACEWTPAGDRKPGKPLTPGYTVENLWRNVQEGVGLVWEF